MQDTIQSDHIYLDIETIPSQDIALMDKFRAEVTAPAQYKKADSIAQWLSENREDVARDMLNKTSFDPAFGHVCTIGYALGGGPVCIHHADTIDKEADILRAFFAAIPKYRKSQFVGHYITGFDLRFILCRAVILGVSIPREIPRDPKPWADSVFDTMTAWAGAKGSVSQDKLSQALGLEGKGDFDGSMVAEAWGRGDHKTIADYCARDVGTVRSIHRKFIAANW